MSRTPGASGLIDVRGTAVAQDYVITQPCAPGAAEAQARRKLLTGCNHLLDNCQPPACGYDRKKDFISLFGAFFIIATCLGIVHTFSIFVPTGALEYGAGFLTQSVVAALTYLCLIIAACAASPVIEYAGHKLTAIFGMTFVFVGVLLDSQVFHIAVLWVGNALFVGIGAGLAYAASFTLPSDLFRKKILIAMVIVDASGSFGTIFFTWFCTEIIDVLGYKWTKLAVAILVLFFTLGVHAFPKTRLMYAHGCQPNTKKGDKVGAIRECVYKAAADKAPPSNTCDEETSRNWLCVCVCDLRLYRDKSFMLWGILVLVGTMNFHLAYLFMNSYAETRGAELSAWYVTVYCSASIIFRMVFIRNQDYTFRFNRVVFLASLILSGAVWIGICWAETFGWIIVCCFLLGGLEGILCVVISRLTLGTIPRRWIGGAWIACLLCHALGMFFVTLFAAAVAQKTLRYYVPFITTGIIQIIAAFLAILLPNEEDEGCDGEGIAPLEPSFTSTYKSSMLLNRPNVDYLRSCYGLGSTREPLTGFTKSSIDYKCECPICSKIGCLTSCCPETCTPGGSVGMRNLNNQPTGTSSLRTVTDSRQTGK